MTQLEKLILKFFTHPQSLKYKDLQKVLDKFGFKEIRAKGSHKKFKHSLLEQDLVVPIHNNECKAFYKKLAHKIIKDQLL